MKPVRCDPVISVTISLLCVTLELYGLRSEFELLGEPLRSATKITDAAAFVRLKTAMLLLGITEDQQSQIFQATAAILHLGNLRFATDPQAKTVSVVNESTLSMAATLLGVPSGLIVKYLTKRYGTLRLRLSVATLLRCGITAKVRCHLNIQTAVISRSNVTRSLTR